MVLRAWFHYLLIPSLCHSTKKYFVIHRRKSNDQIYWTIVLAKWQFELSSNFSTDFLSMSTVFHLFHTALWQSENRHLQITTNSSSLLHRTSTAAACRTPSKCHAKQIAVFVHQLVLANRRVISTDVIDAWRLRCQQHNRSPCLPLKGAQIFVCSCRHYLWPFWRMHWASNKWLPSLCLFSFGLARFVIECFWGLSDCEMDLHDWSTECFLPISCKQISAAMILLLLV